MQFHIPYHIYTQKYPTKRLALYYAIRDCIASGVLVIDKRLPSSREIAAPPAPSVTAHTFISHAYRRRKWCMVSIRCGTLGWRWRHSGEHRPKRHRPHAKNMPWLACSDRCPNWE